MLDRQMPHALIITDNPIFDSELRHMRWPRSITDLKRYGLYVLVALHLLIGAGWLLGHVATMPFINSATLLTYTVILSSGVVIMIVSDLYYALTTVGTINHQIAEGQWDLLRITDLRGENILLAKYAIAQIRAWRLMTVEIGIRVAGIVFVALLNLQLSLVLLITFPVSIYLAILIVAYLAEPLWRMRAVVALGFAIGAWIHNYPFAVLAALGTTLVMQLSRLVVLAALWYVAFGLLSSRNGIFCLLPVVSLAITYLLYFFYQVLQRISLRQALRFGILPG